MIKEVELENNRLFLYSIIVQLLVFYFIDKSMDEEIKKLIKLTIEKRFKILELNLTYDGIDITNLKTIDVNINNLSTIFVLIDMYLKQEYFGLFEIKDIIENLK